MSIFNKSGFARLLMMACFSVAGILPPGGISAQTDEELEQIIEERDHNNDGILTLEDCNPIAIAIIDGRNSITRVTLANYQFDHHCDRVLNIEDMRNILLYIVPVDPFNTDPINMTKVIEWAAAIQDATENSIPIPIEAQGYDLNGDSKLSKHELTKINIELLNSLVANCVVGDMNGDTHVNYVDRGFLGMAILNPCFYFTRGDFDGDGFCTCLDWAYMAANWTEGEPPGCPCENCRE